MKRKKLLVTALVLTLTVSTLAMTVKTDVKAANDDVTASDYLDEESNVVSTSENGVDITYDMNSWETGYWVSYKLTNNTGKTLENWTVKLSRKQVNIDSSWCANIETTDDEYVLTPLSWNTKIPNGSSIEFGFLGVGELEGQIDAKLKFVTPASSHYDPTATISESIPEKYSSIRSQECSGTVKTISYTAHDSENGNTYTKKANIYLPANYSESKKYNVLYLLHGIGGDENEWEMYNDESKVKAMMDNLSYYGDIDSFIVVTPNGKASESGSIPSFYAFGDELRNDLIPYIDSHFSTYADRDHRACAGLSMGGMQTINIGIGQCVDLFSYFGAFSAAPTSNPAATTAEILADNEYPIHYFYNICGLQDGIAYWSASSAAKNLPEVCDQFVDGENFMWQELDGEHNFDIWYLGFYNFAQIVFK